jgi:hypothetical protein
MGQRANLVIVRDGDWCLYYDHWCANNLNVELFWGPKLAIEFIEQLEPKGNSYWTDEVWCEGAAVIDVDHRVLLFYGSDDWTYWDISHRRAHLSLMKETWPGWEIKWAHEGILSVVQYLGLSDEGFLPNAEPDPDAQFRILTEFPEDNLTLLTTAVDKITSAGRINGDDESLRLGPAQLDELPKFEATHSFAWERDMPQGGVHVDFDRSILSFWFAVVTPAIMERVGAGWPGWEINWLQDRYEEHLELSGIDILLPDRPLSDLQAEILDRLRRCCHHEAKNIAKELAPRLGATDINPATDEARSSVGEQAEKLQLLTDLSKQSRTFGLS